MPPRDSLSKIAKESIKAGWEVNKRSVTPLPPELLIVVYKPDCGVQCFNGSHECKKVVRCRVLKKNSCTASVSAMNSLSADESVACLSFLDFQLMGPPASMMKNPKVGSEYDFALPSLESTYIVHSHDESCTFEDSLPCFPVLRFRRVQMATECTDAMSGLVHTMAYMSPPISSR